MEPISALALACNVLDLVERGIKCGRLVCALYRDGTTGDQEALETMVDTMGSVVVALEAAPKSANIRKVTLDPQIDKLLARSTTLCTKLRDLIKKCQPATKGSWKTAGLAALRKAAHKSEVEALEKDLESCRNGLIALFSAVTHQNVVDMKAELEKMGIKNDGIFRKIGLFDDSLRTSTDDLQQKLEMLLAAFREAQDVIKENRILQALVFTDMDARFISIHQAERDTFSWIFDSPQELLEKEPDLTTSFTDWLRSGSDIFHVVGKPGAGKSALMKYLCERDETRDLLEEWAAAGGRELIFCKFFFWRITPVAEQKTLKGLIRGLLHGVLTQVPSLSQRLFPRLWDAKRVVSSWGRVEIGDRDVSNAFESLMSDTTIFDNFSLCFFIDGLDEFEQSIALQSDTHATLAAKLQQWSKNSGGCVKMCVSSRPLLEFVKSFPASQRLTLQKLTENDIRTLVTHRLQDNGRFIELQRRSEHEGRRCDKLLEKILTEAEGVFLWVVLVLSELEQALADSDSLEVLERIVATSYKDIKDFIRNIVLSIPRRHRLGSYYLLAVVLRMLDMFTSETEATANLRAALEGTIKVLQDVNVYYISLAECAMLFNAADSGNLLDCDEKLAEITLNLEERPEAAAKEKDRLLARCRGLVEVDPETNIRFTHRTIPEALQDLFFSNTLDESIQDSRVTEILAWIVLADVRLHRPKEPSQLRRLEYHEPPMNRLQYLSMTHFRISAVPLEHSERMMNLLCSIHDTLLLIQYGTTTLDDNLWHGLSWPRDPDGVFDQRRELGDFNWFQFHEFIGWLIDHKLSPRRDKNRLLGYLRLIVTLAAGGLPWTSPAASEAVLSRMLQQGLTLDAEHSPDSVHGAGCGRPECRLWHEFLFEDLVHRRSHECLHNFRGYEKSEDINWKGLEVPHY
ncbi:hypothetical protein B0T18DRAFT_431491 [Schizothecium vesticola]|uniref:Nephrocystin 3-like N-terminal domain-containing protein n=1 Tax=Schizothecium vesticola TaxID=314040 RepID=A0AA40BTJ3_9PEZI|nr:hypothetical protein B0T18DRAFT_431491 [Schizothecium vesticola]